MHWIRNRLENGKHAFFTNVGNPRISAPASSTIRHLPKKNAARGCALAAAIALASAPGR